MEETRLFSVRTSNDSLIITLPLMTQVVSGAPLHGGLRARARHILIHQVDADANGVESATNLRRAASRAGLSGTVVGMCTTGSLANYRVCETRYEELRTATLCVTSVGNLVAVGEEGSFVENRSTQLACGGIHVILATNYKMTQEAMLEAMGIAIEAKVQVLCEFGLQSRRTSAIATGSAMDCVAVTSGHNRRYQFAGKSTKWGELIGRACLEGLRAAFQSALATSARSSPNGS